MQEDSANCLAYARVSTKITDSVLFVADYSLSVKRYYYVLNQNHLVMALCILLYERLVLNYKMQSLYNQHIITQLLTVKRNPPVF